MTAKQVKPQLPDSNKPQAGMAVAKQLCLALALVCCIVYGNTLSNSYALDDIFMITGNDYVKAGIKGIPDLLTTPHLKGFAPNLTDTYRPLSLVMFAVEYQLFGETPAAGHLVNILVFIGAVLLLFTFIDKLLDGKRTLLAFITALLFAVHPIHTEVVANIKSRDELLCFFFGFLSLNIFINYARSGKMMQLALGTLCLLLSIISKETTATFIAAVPLIFFLYVNEHRKRAVLITVSTFGVVAAFIIIRAILINKYKADGMIVFSLLDNSLTGAPNAASKLATAILILGHYLKLMLVPYPLICDYAYNSIPYTSFTDPLVLLSLCAYMALVITAIYLLTKNKKNLWALGILFYLIMLSMFSNIFFIVGATQADRFTFFASAGSCLLMALAAERWLLRSEALSALRSPRAVILAAICVVYAGVAISRNTDWKDDYTLYKTDAEKSPNNTRLYAFVGTELQKKYEAETDPEKKIQLNAECVKYLRQAIALYPGNAPARAELGTAYLIANMQDSAISQFKQALELNPRKMNALTNLGALYSMQGKYADAIPYYEKAVTYESTDLQSQFNLAIAYLQVRKYDAAIKTFRTIIAQDPSYNQYMSYANMAAVYNLMGQPDSAIKYKTIADQHSQRVNQ